MGEAGQGWGASYTGACSDVLLPSRVTVDNNIFCISKKLKIKKEEEHLKYFHCKEMINI